MDDYILETKSLTRKFEGFVAVSNVDLKVKRGEIHALIGPNGAGKTTFFNLLTKFLSPTTGHIFYNGQDITNDKPAEVARRGIIRSFQISAVFPHLTVLENVRIGLQRKLGTSYHFWKSKKTLEQLNFKVMDLLEAVDLAAYASYVTVELPYGRKRALEIATTLAMEPELMLLDEPTAGHGARRCGPSHKPDQEGIGQPHHPDGGAQHECGRGDLRHHHRARGRKRHRRGDLCTGVERPAGDGSVHGGSR